MPYCQLEWEIPTQWDFTSYCEGKVCAMGDSRQRVMDALEHKIPDRLPKDLGAMGSTGISVFAYPTLVEALGLPPRRPRAYDTFQMLALPDPDVLDALGCDVVTVVLDRATNAFEEPERWHDYDFNGRLPARVTHPEAFEVLADGTIRNNLRRGQRRLSLSMPPKSFVFDAEHGLQPFDIAGDLSYVDTGRLRNDLREQLLTDEKVVSVREYCRRVRSATGRAVMFSGLMAGLDFTPRGGIPEWSMMCIKDPDHVREVHDIVSDHAVENVRRLLPEIRDSVDMLMVDAADHGIQTTTILPPSLFDGLFVPYYRKVNDAIGEIAPGVKRFLHCCGAVYDIIDGIIASGFDILNPVQWPAGKRSYKEWKDKARGRIAFWGGGINSQKTLPFGSVEDVVRETAEVVAYLKQDSGYVADPIHNIVAGVPPENIIAFYKTAASV